MSRYDSFAREFETHAQDGAYNAHYDRPAVLGLVGDVTGSRVLDAGCGPGLYSAELLARGAHVTAFDQSAEMVELARRRLGGSVTLRVHDGDEPLDWAADESFDIAVLALVLHHLEHPERALRELHRVLTPDGVLVVSTVHPTLDWRNRGGSYFTEEVVEETWQGTWSVRYRRRPLDAWCADFFAAGFVIERLIEPQSAPSMQDRHPAEFERLSTEPGFIAFRLRKR